jgi:hypothetical protein
MDIGKWCHEIAEDMQAFEDHEWVIYHVSEKEAAICYVIRCLANPKCEGSAEVLNSIAERRLKMIEEG